MFINREKELRELEEFLAHIMRGNRLNVALFGLRRIGKTELLLEFRERNSPESLLVPYINMQRIIPDVDSFSRNFLCEILFELAKKKGMPKRPVTWDELLILSTSLDLGDAVVGIKDLLERREVDVGAVLGQVFSLPERISAAFDVRVIVIIDEFQEILFVHERMLKMMRGATEKQKGVSYWVSGSVFSRFDDLFGYENPFFGQFRRISLGSFDRASGSELIDRMLPFRLGDDERRAIFDMTGGGPFYLTAVCERILQEYAVQKKMDHDLVRYCILDELLGETGKINEHFDYIMAIALSKFSNRDIYKRILLYLSDRPETLASISRHLGKPSGEVMSYLRALLKTDLIVKRNGDYSIRDPLFRGWVSKALRGVDRFSLQDKKTFESIFSDLKQRYEKVSTELGMIKEHELGAILEETTGNGFEPYSSSDGQVEFDLVGKVYGVVVLIEVKWRNRPVTIREVEKLYLKLGDSEFAQVEKRAFILSRSGFKKNALKRADEYGIICLDRDISAICDFLPGPDS